MDIYKLKNIYLIGIGGIGMSALARFFNQRGVAVSGYDKTVTELTQQLELEGIKIHYSDSISLVNKAAELVIYTPAIPPNHEELNWYQANNYPVFKRSDVLQWITETMTAVTVAGTHGKTTISTLIAYILRASGKGCNAFLGGISANYQTNYWSSDNNLAVIEADEYDRSFLKLKPDIAVLTAMDADHLDIYGTVEEMEKAFIEYTTHIKPNGILIAKFGLKRGNELQGAHELITYSLQNESATIFASNILQKDGGYQFDVHLKDEIISNIHLPIGGMHNIENTVAAIAVAHQLGVSAEKIVQALIEFKGVKRRFEYVIKTEKLIFIDDYAHHPEELAALIKSAKRLFPNRKTVVVFQPHLFSRTRDFADGFAHSLDLADEVILLEIYPARELPIAGVDAAMIKSKMTNEACTILSKEGLLDYVKLKNLDLLITAGAGDIDKLVAPIKQILNTK